MSSLKLEEESMPLISNITSKLDLSEKWIIMKIDLKKNDI